MRPKLKTVSEVKEFLEGRWPITQGDALFVVESLVAQVRSLENEVDWLRSEVAAANARREAR